jgi:hypothetical protein
MQSTAKTTKEYIDSLPEERRAVISELQKAILCSLPQGFREEMNYGMIGYVVPHSLYPNGYHCNPKLPLPFINIASQKNFIALYHLGLYGNKTLLDWFVSEFPKHTKYKLDMGKACIRFKKMDDIPYKLIEELASKISVEDWISCCEKKLKR